MPQLFVYGTLMVGRPAHGLLAPWVRSATPGFLVGHLYQMPAGYPAFVEADSGTVHGEVLELSEDLSWANVDAYEGCDPDDPGRSLYLRVQRPVQLAGAGIRTAWCYLLVPGALPGFVERGAFRLPDGRWPPSI